MATMEWQWIGRFTYSTLKEPGKRPRIAGSDANYPSTVLDLPLNILENITKNRFQSDKFQIDFKLSDSYRY